MPRAHAEGMPAAHLTQAPTPVPPAKGFLSCGGTGQEGGASGDALVAAALGLLLLPTRQRGQSRT